MTEIVHIYGLGPEVLSRSEYIWHFRDFCDLVGQAQQEDMPRALQEISAELSGSLEKLVISHKPLSPMKSSGISVAESYDDPDDGKAFPAATDWDKVLK